MASQNGDVRGAALGSEQVRGRGFFSASNSGSWSRMAASSSDLQALQLENRNLQQKLDWKQLKINGQSRDRLKLRPQLLGGVRMAGLEPLLARYPHPDAAAISDGRT